MHRLLSSLDRGIAAVEKVALVLLSLALVLLPLTQVVMRIAGLGGLPWAHELIRLFVLWLAFLGATLATRERRHITLDLLDRSLSPRTKAVFNLVVQAVAAALMGYLACVAYTFVALQRDMGDRSSVLQLPEWIALSIVPIALTILTWRFALLILEDVRGLRSGDFAYLSGPSREGRLY